MAIVWSRRTSDLHTEQVEGSILAYDTSNDLVHCVADDSRAVYEACDGASVEQIAERTGFASDVVAAHVRELADRGLVSAEGGDQLSRKRLLAAASAAAAVTFWTMAVPTPAAASSTAPVTTTPSTVTTTTTPTFTPGGL